MEPRFSLTRLLVGVTVFALCLGIARSYAKDASAFDVSVGGLSFCALCFAGMSRWMGRRWAHVFWHTGVLYAWGFVCLELGHYSEIGSSTRWVLAVSGMVYAVWGCLPPLQIPAQPDGPFSDRVE